MYWIMKTDFGLRVSFGGKFDLKEVGKYATELEITLAELEPPFSMIADCRSMIAPELAVLAILQECEQMTRNGGLERMAIILSTDAMVHGAEQFSKHTGSAEAERYINAAENDDWEQLALDWVIKGVEPATARC